MALVSMPYIAITWRRASRRRPQPRADEPRVRPAPDLIVRHVLIPSIAPFVFAGVRLSFALAWKVEQLTEVFGASSGIGFLIRREFSTSRSRAARLGRCSCLHAPPGALGAAPARAPPVPVAAGGGHVVSAGTSATPSGHPSGRAAPAPARARRRTCSPAPGSAIRLRAGRLADRRRSTIACPDRSRLSSS